MPAFNVIARECALPDGHASPFQITDQEIREMLRRTALPAWHYVRPFLVRAPALRLGYLALTMSL